MTVPLVADPGPTSQSAPMPASMLERMTLILDAFDVSTPTLSLSRLAERTGLPRSTLHRILDQMVRLHWLGHTVGGYRLGLRPLELGGLAAEHHELRAIMRPRLEALGQRTGLVAHLAVLERREIVFVDRVVGKPGTTVPSRLGGRLPAHSTASGKAMLACLESSAVDATFRAPLPRPTPSTLRDVDELHRELARIRNRHGLAFDREETATGIACVAAPVRGARPVLAAISVCGDSQAMNVERTARLVLEASCEASQALTHAGRGRRLAG